MKKVVFYKAAMAAFLSLAIFACKPVEPEGDGANQGDNTPEVPEEPVEVERSIKLYNAAAEISALEFTPEFAKCPLGAK